MNKMKILHIGQMIGGLDIYIRNSIIYNKVESNEDGNAKVGNDIRLYDCKNCVVHAADERKVVVQGLDGYIVAEKHGQLLVCSLKEEQRIKEFGK